MVKPISLERWFQINFRRPLYFVVAFCVFILCLRIVGQSYETSQRRKEYVYHLTNLVALGLSQKNQKLIETTLELAKKELLAEQLTLRFKNQNIISIGESRSSTFSPEQIVEVPGFSEYEIYFRYSWLPRINWELWAIIFSLLGFFFWMIHKMYWRVNSDILVALTEKFESDEALPLKELNEIRTKQKELVNLKVNLGVKEAVIERNKILVHDIQSPLTALDFLVSANIGSPEHNRLLRRITDQLKQLASQMKQTRSSVGEAHDEELVLKSALSEIIEEKKLEYAGKNITWELEVESGTQAKILCNRFVFKRMISNVINNSVESLDSEDGKIEITGKTDSSEVRVEVRDNGRGFPDEFLKKGIEKGMTYRKQGGSGLGLFFVKEEIGRRGGALNYGARSVKGSFVELRFPR